MVTLGLLEHGNFGKPDIKTACTDEKWGTDFAIAKIRRNFLRREKRLRGHETRRCFTDALRHIADFSGISLGRKHIAEICTGPN
jgi:hypothetical protein